MSKLYHAKFITSAVHPKDYPTIKNDRGQILPEVAVAGRSNVGKSSLLNNLFHSKNLVKTSSTPGKTQLLNFFSLNDQIAFADLPGYGFADVPLAIRKQWGPMVQAYLNKREPLKLILFLLDIRRIPNEEDLQLMDWILFHQKPVIVVLTKVDKVNQSERDKNTKKILEVFNLENLHYIHYSVPKNKGSLELMSLIKQAIKDEENICLI